MEMKDTNTDYQNFFRVGDQKQKLYKLQLDSFFFFLLDIRINDFLYRESDPTRKKLPHLKC